MKVEQFEERDYTKAVAEVVDTEKLDEITALAGTCSKGTSAGGGTPPGAPPRR